jgi:predicted XRE-type DNA-binding protein
MVPQLTQDRVSKIFSGQVGHMTIDKLVTIASALEIKISLKAA